MPDKGLRERLKQQPYRETLALMQAAQEVRGGRWFSGAPSHIFAELAAALNDLGFAVTALDSPPQEEVGEADDLTGMNDAIYASEQAAALSDQPSDTPPACTCFLGDEPGASHQRDCPCFPEQPDYERVTEYRVVSADGQLTSSIWSSLEAADASRVRADDRFPDDAPHRIQQRVVTRSPWVDLPTDTARDALAVPETAPEIVVEELAGRYHGRMPFHVKYSGEEVESRFTFAEAKKTAEADLAIVWPFVRRALTKEPPATPETEQEQAGEGER